MRVKVGEIWYSLKSGRPIMVELTDKDKENIRNMLTEATCYAEFQPDDPDYPTNEDRLDWMRKGKT